MTYTPMNIPPGPGLPVADTTRWYRRWYVWALAAAVAAGALFYGG